VAAAIASKQPCAFPGKIAQAGKQEAIRTDE